jgi:hypothetical protein
LIKVTSVVIAAPSACLVFQRFRVSAFQHFKLWTYAAIALIPTAIWYWHAYQISRQFYPHHFFGAGGIQIMSVAWYLKIARLITTSTLTPVLFILGLVGLFLKSRAYIFHWWFAAMVFSIIVVGYGNRHQWYQLPLVPIFAAFAGATCALVAQTIANRPLKVTLAFALIATFGSLSFFYARSFYDPAARPLRDGGLALNRITPADALIVGADNGDPTLLYYAHRKGWHFLEKDGIYDGEPRDSAQAIVDLERLRRRGASYLVLTSNTAWWLDYYAELGAHVAATSRIDEVTSEFKICKLDPVSK